jgi:hypothetical protein
MCRTARGTAICIDIEGNPNEAGSQPNRLIKARGPVKLLDDEDGCWTRKITLKYVPGVVGYVRAAYRAGMPRIAMRLKPEVLLAIGTADQTVNLLP